jgi:hypothetical protein
MLHNYTIERWRELISSQRGGDGDNASRDHVTVLSCISAIISSSAKANITQQMTNTSEVPRQMPFDEHGSTPLGARSSAPALPMTRQFIWTARSTLFAALTVFLTWAIAASLWSLTDTVVPWDSKNHFYPMLRYLGASFANGEMPLWNPYHFSGHPAVADPQSLLFTPTMALFGWLMPSPSMQVFDVVVFAHLLAGGLAVVGLVRSRGWRPESAVLAAVIFMLGGSATARLQHTGIIISYSFLPIALLCLEATLSRYAYKAAIAFGITAALMALGRDQVAFLGCVLLLAVIASHFMATKQRWMAVRRLAGPLTLAGMIGGAILVIPAILTIQFLSTSNRPDIAFGVAAMGSLPPQSLATLLFADIFGSLRFTFDYWGPSTETLREGTWTDRSIQYCFCRHTSSRASALVRAGAWPSPGA